MTNEERVLKYLKVEPRFRERKQKNRGIINLLREDYPELKHIDKDVMVKVVKEFSSLNRAWRRVLQKGENSHLRGADYYEKHKLELKKQRELGYNRQF